MNLKLNPIALISILIFLFSISSINGVTIMSVDFGSEWMKIAVVAPGIPMEIALNKESKRKTPVVIAFRNGERTFGDEALAARMKEPSSSYAYLLDLVGKTLDNQIIKVFKERFPFYKIESHDKSRKSVCFRRDEDTVYSVEELIAQILNNAREIAMAHTNQKIKDLVITVPSFFNQAERRSILNAAELANLKVLSLMSSNAAIALNYGMYRRKEINETVENILFYDMGASSTTASIVAYQTIKTKEKGYTETNPQLTVLGMGFDRTLGGLQMQLRLRNFLARKFNEMKKTPNDAFANSRAMGKFMKEAGKLKIVLSANSEHLSQIEGVLDDKDFSIKVTRADFELLCGDLFKRVQAPIDEALISAQIDMKDIHKFIIVGGNTRMPKIQSILQEVWGKELGKNINADEAAAIGAVYRAADLGRGYKVLKFHVKEAVLYPIDIDFMREIGDPDNENSRIKVFNRVLFPRGSISPQKRVMTFNKHTQDFRFSVGYGKLDFLTSNQAKTVSSSDDRAVCEVTIEGVTDLFKKHLEDGAVSKGIKAHLNMDDSGLVFVTSVEAIFEKNVTVEVEKEEESTLSKIGSTLSKLFSGDVDTSSVDTKNQNESDNESGSEEKKTDAEEKKKDEEKSDKEQDSKDNKTQKIQLVTTKEDLVFKVHYLDIISLSEEEVQESKKRIENINAEETARKDTEQARNNLETYILDVREKFTHEDYEAAVTQEIKDDLLLKADEFNDWLYDDGFDQEAPVYNEKMKILEKIFEPIKNRVLEHLERPEALKALNEMINASSTFLYRAQNAGKQEKYFTDVELKSLDDILISTQKWMELKIEEQENTPAYEEPKLPLYSIADKIQSIDREIKYLINKGRLAKAKMDKELAEAKAKKEEKRLKEAAEKAKAEWEAKNNNITEDEASVGNETENLLGDEEIGIKLPISTEADSSDSRKEPPMPTEEEYSVPVTEEEASVPILESTYGQSNRRKVEEEEIESTPILEKLKIEL